VILQKSNNNFCCSVFVQQPVPMRNIAVDARSVSSWPAVTSTRSLAGSILAVFPGTETWRDHPMKKGKFVWAGVSLVRRRISELIESSTQEHLKTVQDDQQTADLQQYNEAVAQHQHRSGRY
jgi:hypothetical protein